MTMFWIADGDAQCSCFVEAETLEEACDIWEDDNNPYGYEVVGHPWLWREGCRAATESETTDD